MYFIWPLDNKNSRKKIKKEFYNEIPSFKWLIIRLIIKFNIYYKI